MSDIRVALDVMGGDRAPVDSMEGAVRAVREDGAQVLLCGDERVVRDELQRLEAQDLIDHGLQIRHASEVVAMDEKPAQAARKKKNSSIRVALDLLKTGEAGAMVSAGNSGAVMATALLALGRIKGVLRPAILSSSPNLTRRTVLLDVGANTVVGPEILAQWAYMGDAYARLVEGCAKPKVGVLSNGEEDAKGTDLTRGANALLHRAPDLNYVGYAEGRDVAGGDFDVIVTDGFTGNVVLKTMEGSGKFVSQFFKAEFQKSWARKLGYLLSQSVFAGLRKISDYREYGGAPLLGINGAVIIAHGGSDALAISRAIAQGKRHVDVGLNAQISEVLQQHTSLWARRPASKVEATATPSA